MERAFRSDREASEQRIDEDWGSLLWLAGRQFGNAQGTTLGRVTIKPGRSNPRHRHMGSEEVLYLLRGRLRHSVGSETVCMSAGDVIVVPAGVVHHATNVGDEEADMIVAYPTGARDMELES